MGASQLGFRYDVKIGCKRGLKNNNMWGCAEIG